MTTDGSHKFDFRSNSNETAHIFASIATTVNINMKFSSITAIIATFPASSALCPQGFEIPAGLEGETHTSWVRHSRRLAEVPPPPEPTPEYIKAVATLDIDAVKDDLKAVMTDSKDWWPAGKFDSFVFVYAFILGCTHCPSHMYQNIMCAKILSSFSSISSLSCLS